jgi:hypothetical protein
MPAAALRFVPTARVLTLPAIAELLASLVVGPSQSRRTGT